MLPIECICVFYMRLENTVLTNDSFNEVSTFLVQWELNLYTKCARILGFKWQKLLLLVHFPQFLSRKYSWQLDITIIMDSVKIKADISTDLIVCVMIFKVNGLEEINTTPTSRGRHSPAMYINWHSNTCYHKRIITIITNSSKKGHEITREQCTYNVLLKRVYGTTFAMEKE